MDGTLIVMNDNKDYSDDVFTPAEAARLNVVGRVVWRGCRM
jgi:phage repressor protein C with HTH and peptisase S24 domain